MNVPETEAYQIVIAQALILMILVKQFVHHAQMNV
jgi:hypothetical protein